LAEFESTQLPGKILSGHRSINPQSHPKGEPFGHLLPLSWRFHCTFIQHSCVLNAATELRLKVLYVELSIVLQQLPVQLIGQGKAGALG